MKTNLDTKGWEQRWKKIMYPGFNNVPKIIQKQADKQIKRETNFIRQELSLAKQQWIEEIGKKWNERVAEVKQGLDKEYGKNHNYTPNYEGIFDDILSYLKGEMK